MTKKDWLILFVSATTDFIVTAGTSMTSAMVAMGTTEMPSRAVVVLSALGGLVAFSRTVQQALRKTQE